MTKRNTSEVKLNHAEIGEWLSSSSELNGLVSEYAEEAVSNLKNETSNLNTYAVKGEDYLDKRIAYYVSVDKPDEQDYKGDTPYAEENRRQWGELFTKGKIYKALK